MARKLSGFAGQGCCSLAAALWLAAASTAAAQNDVRVSSPTNIVENPFAAGDELQSVIVPEEPEPPNREAATFRNPFATMPRSTARPATMQMAPPVAPPTRPGPISRWQRSNLLADEPSSVRTAILDANPSNYDAMAQNPLSLIDAPGGANFGQPPDPIQFAPRSLAQPAWLNHDIHSARPLLHGGTSADVVPITIDTFNVPESSLDLAANDRAEFDVDTNAAGDGIAPPVDPDWLPIVVSDRVHSPENCYAEARQASDTARTVDDFSSVIDWCHRGLDGGPSQELALALRRLAAWAHNRRGELRNDAREQHDALADFQAAVSLDRNCWAAIHNRGITLAEQGQTSAALRDFNRVLELNPGLTVAYRNRAELLASLGRMGEAVRDYSQALNQAPHDAGLYRARGYAWQRLGDFDRALVDLNKSLSLDPNQPDTYTQRGNLSAEQGDFDRAVSNYQQALRIDPHWAEAHRSLAWLWATCPNPRYRNADRALAEADEAMSLAPPGDSFALDAAAAAQANAGRFNQAIQLQQQALAAAPPDIAEQMRERLVLYQQGQPYRSGQLPTAIKPASHTSPASGTPTDSK